MKLIVSENTYPRYPNVARAETGDVVRWEAPSRGTDGMILRRLSDGKAVFIGPKPRRTGQWDQVTVGTVAEVRSRGWRLVLRAVDVALAMVTADADAMSVAPLTKEDDDAPE